MATLFVQNDMNLLLSAMAFSADNTVINDAELIAHFFDPKSDVPITNATNASPIVVTAAGHGLTTGTVVVVAHVTGNEAANGCWTVTVVDANTFSLNGSTGNGAYNRGGDCYKAIANGTNLNLAYVTGSNGCYMATIPYTIDRLAGESCRCIIFCSNYNFQLERDHSSIIRT